MKQKQSSTHPGQKRFYARNPPVSTYIPEKIKKKIVKLVKAQNKNNGDGEMSYSKWCRLWIISFFDEELQRKMLGDAVILDHKKEAEEKFADEFKEQYIAEGEKSILEEIFVQSITKEVCPKKGCGGRLIRLSHPIQKDNKVDIQILQSAICEKCGFGKEG